MNDVCSIELLQNAVARGLSAEEESALHAHLEHCEACCTQMEQLAGGESWQQEAAALLSADELDAAVPEPANWSEVDFSVEHLDPSDNANVLGQLGGYDVLAIVGRGGMGVVLKALDRELKRLVAIKALAPHLAHSSVARKRFAREAQAAAAVVNPHVIAIHHVQPTGRLPFLIMPLLTGESLAQRLKARGPLELTEVLRIGMQAATGLAAAHDQGLVHRDVKPANIFLEKGVERVVITDFGLARAADDVSMTRLGVVAGTPEYMSPEQARGEALDGRSDLFSLGCVLYEMATGVSPFRTDSTLATLRRIVDEQPAAMASLVPELPPWFSHIVERLLSKDPAQRFASASEVSQLLEQCLSHLQQPTSVPLPASLVPHAAGRRSIFNVTRKGVLAMLGTIGMIFWGMVLLPATEAPDISGRWTSGEWGTVVLEAKEPGRYEGNFSASGQDKSAPSQAGVVGGLGIKVDVPSLGPIPNNGRNDDKSGTFNFQAGFDRESSDKGKSGTLHLKWSRVERRFNGTWHEGTDRFGKISVRLVDDEIRGAWTTSKGAQKESGTPRRADLLWKRSSDNTAKKGEQSADDSQPGKIHRVDAERKVAWINLGTADSVKVGMKFQVRANATENAKDRAPIVKGSVEVIRILDQHLSEVRILKEDLEHPVTVNDAVIVVIDPKSLATAANQFNADTAEVRSKLFAPPIPDLTVERLRAGFRQTANLYRRQGKRQVADALEKIAESGQLPKEASHMIGSGVHAQDENGETISRQVVPALVLPDDTTSTGNSLVVLQPLELIYRKDGPISKDYGDQFNLDQDGLEGVWEVALEPGTVEPPEDQRHRLVFAGGWFATFQGLQRLSASRFKVEPQHNPKRISGVDLGVGWTIPRGIYEVNEDSLQLNLAPDTEGLPTKFSTNNPKLKRVKGKLAEEQLAALKRYSVESTAPGIPSDSPEGLKTRPQPTDREQDKDAQIDLSFNNPGPLTKTLPHESRIPVRAKLLVIKRDWSNADELKPQDGIRKSLSELPDTPVSRAARAQLAKAGSLGPDDLVSNLGLPSVFGAEDFASLQSWLRDQGLLLGELPVEQKAERRAEERWTSWIDLSAAHVEGLLGKWWLTVDMRPASARPDEQGIFRVVDHPYYLALINTSRTQQVMERQPGGPHLRGAALSKKPKFSFYLPKKRVVAIDWDAPFTEKAAQLNEPLGSKVILIFEDAEVPEPRSTVAGFRLPERIGSLLLDDENRWLSPPDKLGDNDRAAATARPEPATDAASLPAGHNTPVDAATPPLKELRKAAAAARNALLASERDKHTHPPIEFRIAVSKADREADEVAWFPIIEPRTPAPAGKSGANLPIEEILNEKWHGLLSNKVEHTLIADGSWRVEKCEVAPSAQSTDLVPSFEIRITLDAVGGALLRRLVSTHLNQPLAIVVDGTIVAAPVLRSEFGLDIVISGNFSKETAEKLAAAIRKPDLRKTVSFLLRFVDVTSAVADMKAEAAGRKIRGFDATIDPRLNAVAITAEPDTLEALREILSRLDSVEFVPAFRAENPSKNPTSTVIELADLGPQHDGKEVTMIFKITDTQLIGGEREGAFPHVKLHYDGMKKPPHLGVYVKGELADVLHRSACVAPDDKLVGRSIKATGTIKLHTDFPKGEDQTPVYQLDLRDWKKFQILPEPKTKSKPD